MAFQGVIRVRNTIAAILASLWIAGCTGVSVVPTGLQDKIERDVSFQQVKDSPQSYKGKFIVGGGTVLSVKPLKEGGTRIEILQLPLASNDEPHGPLMKSGGRFLALHKAFLDPATIPTGTRVTVVGEVTGSMTLSLDEVDYVYPTLEIASLTIWPPNLPPYWYRSYPYFSAYWGPPQWGPYRWPGRR